MAPAQAHLPVELWLQIFGYLPYFDLKACSKVSKGLREILQHQSLDASLFRSNSHLGKYNNANPEFALVPMSESPIPPFAITLHPLFPFAEVFTDSITGILTALQMTPRGRKEVSNCVGNIHDEFATYPPVSGLTVSPSDPRETRWIIQAAGIKVEDVMICIKNIVSSRAVMRHKYMTWDKLDVTVAPDETHLPAHFHIWLLLEDDDQSAQRKLMNWETNATRDMQQRLEEQHHWRGWKSLEH